MCLANAEFCYNGFLTEPFLIRCGVRKGRAIALLLFNIFIEFAVKIAAVDLDGIGVQIRFRYGDAWYHYDDSGVDRGL